MKPAATQSPQICPFLSAAAMVRGSAVIQPGRSEGQAITCVQNACALWHQIAIVDPTGRQVSVSGCAFTHVPMALLAVQQAIAGFVKPLNADEAAEIRATSNGQSKETSL